MKMVFKLSSKQLDRAKQEINKSNVAYREVLDNFPIEEWVANGLTVTGFHNYVTGAYFAWLGDILGFHQLSGKMAVPELFVSIREGKLEVVGTRAAISNPKIVEQIAIILGKTWRVAIPESIEGDASPFNLFWWETTEHYTQWRSDWDTYFAWLLPQVDEEKRIQKFDGRFHNENECLQLLRSGKFTEAKHRYPSIADQILKVA